MILSVRDKLAVRNGEAVRIPEDELECVVLRADLYDRLRHLLYDDGEWPGEDLRRIFAKSAEANGWNEPEMEDYDHYDERMVPRYFVSGPHRMGCSLAATAAD